MKDFKYVVYQIRINNVVRYIGHTKDIDRRELEHRRNYKKGVSKQFFKYLSSVGYKPEDIVLEPIHLAKNKVEAKRYEAYTILYFHFNSNQLKQKVPNIKDGF